MSEETKFVVFVSNETIADSVYKDIVSAILIAFCVYISHESTWWTFVTGSIFLLFMFGKINQIMKKQNKFRTKEELQSWVDELED